MWRYEIQAVIRDNDVIHVDMWC